MLIGNRLDFSMRFASGDLNSRVSSSNDVGVRTSALTSAASPVGSPVTSALGTPHTIFPGNVDTMPIIYQGQTNGCGTTSLAMILSYETGKPYTRESVDSDIRRLDTFTSPEHIVEYSRSQGLESEGYNHGSADELRSFLDRGIPVQLIVNAQGVNDPTKLHYVAVVGYYTDPAGNMTGVRVHNSGTGAVEDWDMAELESKWGAASPGFDHFFIAHAPGGTDLPAGRWEGLEGVRLFALGVANGANNLDRVIDPHGVGDWVHGAIALPNSVEEAAFGVAATAGQIGIDYAQKEVGKVPVLSNIVLPGVDLFEGQWQAGTNLAQGGFESFEHGADAAGDLLDGHPVDALEDAGQAITAPIEGVVDAVGSTVGGAVNAIGSLFSGW